jgi:geranylgeranyl diphosphate synthase type II
VTASLTPPLVSETLQEYGGLTRASLADYLPSREPRTYLYDLLADYPQRAGKGMRPSICHPSARAFGARLDDALRSAVAIELLHNALLIHDDIEDGSEERRGRPTLHRLHGIPLAINAGDTLTLMSLRPLLENVTTIGPRLSLRILEETERMARESAEGQALELGWRRDNATEVDDAAYFEMVLKKTCWLATIYPCRVGALIGTGGTVALDPFIRFGFFLGAAFQIHDDVLNLVGDSERYGKELDGDISEGKRTLMLIHLFRTATPDERTRLIEIMSTQRGPGGCPWDREQTIDSLKPFVLEETYEVIEAIDAHDHGALCEDSLVYGALPDSRDKRFLEGLATWVFERGS